MRDPTSMTATERLAEVATILATAYRRFRDGGLASIGDDEALCVEPVNGTESLT